MDRRRGHPGRQRLLDDVLGDRAVAEAQGVTETTCQRGRAGIRGTTKLGKG